MKAECREALHQLGAYLDGELDADAIAGISAHLAACYPCGDQAEFQRHLRVVVRTRVTERAPDALVERVRSTCFGQHAG